MGKYEVEDRGGGRIRPIKGPTYAQIFALPDGADFVIMANVRDEEAEAAGTEPGVYTSGHTMEPALRASWSEKLGDHSPDETRAGDLLLYVLPDGYTNDVPLPDSVLSADEIASDALVKFGPAIFEAAEGGRGALDLFREIIEDTVNRARQGYVIPPF